MTAWTDLVSRIYKENKHKPGYKLKNAMKDAKKVYKKSKSSKHGGDGESAEMPSMTRARTRARSRARSASRGRSRRRSRS